MSDDDPLGLAADAPLLAAYWSFRHSKPTPFTIPGHKQRTDLVGRVVEGDVPLYGGLDTMRVRDDHLARAERQAAHLWGVDVARFSVGGSTHGNQALALAVGRPGDTVVVARTLHRSMLLALVLADLRPVWVRPQVDATTGLPDAIRAEDVALALAENPHASAVFVGEPSYVGTVGDLGAVADAAHGRDVPLIVDAAWGGHFGFHPNYPDHAMALGADALVTSVHKALPGYCQAALILARTERIDPARLAAGVEATATTSPAGAILASIDATRALLARHGEGLLAELQHRVRHARDELGRIDGLLVADGPTVDPAKLVLVLPGTGVDGTVVEADLIASGMPVELADRDTIVAMVTVADTDATVEGFVRAVTASIERHRGEPRAITPSAAWRVDPLMAMSPREAFFAPTRIVPTDDAVGGISADLIAPYPPGIPVLAPGEVITPDAVAGLRAAADAGTRIAYATDPTLATMRVVD